MTYTMHEVIDEPGVATALDGWYETNARKQKFIEEYQDPNEGEPLCGWATWDETMADYNAELADAGEALVIKIREATK